ncbi:MAG: SHOCT domain-containing protein [Candidatus Zixiibacteriota bacterium]
MGFGVGGIGMILFWIAIIAAVVVLVKVLLDLPNKGDRQLKSALDMLKERYAAGEITREEFKDRKRDIVER